MKRLFCVLVALLCCSGVFAKDKRLYVKETKNSLLELYETKVEKHPYYISAYDYVTSDEHDWNVIYCDDKKKAQDFIYYLRNHNLQDIYTYTITYYEVMNDDLTILQDYQDLKDNIFVNIKLYLLE